MTGKLIRLFLADGTPNGIRTVELSNMTIYTTIFPRTKLKEFLKREESQKAGCYILIGEEHRVDETKAYIGEGENVSERLKYHASGANQKEFWNEAIVFTSKDDYITKTQIQYLEAELYKLAKEAGVVALDNAKVPRLPELSEVDTAEMKQFLAIIQLLLSSIGIPILDSKMRKQEEKSYEPIVYEFTIKGAKARMIIEDDQYVLLKGSTAIIENRPSASEGIKKMREKLIKQGFLSLNSEGTFYNLLENYAFDSPSYAASAISGGSENGRRVWKYNNKSINEIEEEFL